MRRADLWLMIVMVPLFGCGDADESPMMCGLQENCVGALEFAPGLVVDGENFSVELVSGDAPVGTTYDWTLKITDSAGSAVTDAAVLTRAFSVDCGHFGPKAGENITADEKGLYTATTVTAHGGPWETVLNIEAGGLSEEIRVFVCVDAPGHGEDGVMGHHE